MRTYYFHIISGGRLLDPRGLGLPDQQAAMHYGQGLAGRLLAVVEVTDVNGKILARCSPLPSVAAHSDATDGPLTMADGPKEGRIR